MTRQETVEVITLIVMAYPASEKLKDEDTVTAMVNVWAQMFKDDNPKLVSLAVQKHIATSKWPPNIAEIREQMVYLQHPEIVPPDVAWVAVSDLMTAGSWADLSILPPLVARCVESIGWSNLLEMSRGGRGGNKPGMDRVAFIAQYTPMYERERERAMLPPAISEAVGKAERILGGETHRQLEAAHQKRLEHDKMWDDIFTSENRLSSGKDGQKLIGGNNEEP